ncbi:hypothetical protein [Actinoplanes sp. HUAS TT8]|uniref:hypothetical protein n=1 Tax=Actinoplanes sp. HUAS TT8 TaxID=3447453 RepID=UPI003F526F8A
MRQKKIVIGFDGSSSAHAALVWGLDEASRTGAGLLGSISRKLLRQADCPVAIVHDLSETGEAS